MIVLRALAILTIVLGSTIVLAQPKNEPPKYSLGQFVPVTAQPQPIYDPAAAPVYPAEAKAKGLEAFIVLSSIIDTNGHATEIKVDKADDSTFIDAAIASLRRTRFLPARNTLAQAFPMAYTAPVIFHLENNIPYKPNTVWKDLLAQFPHGEKIDTLKRDPITGHLKRAALSDAVLLQSIPCCAVVSLDSLGRIDTIVYSSGPKAERLIPARSLLYHPSAAITVDQVIHLQHSLTLRFGSPVESSMTDGHLSMLGWSSPQATAKLLYDGANLMYTWVAKPQH